MKQLCDLTWPGQVALPMIDRNDINLYCGIFFVSLDVLWILRYHGHQPIQHHFHREHNHCHHYLSPIPWFFSSNFQIFVSDQLVYILVCVLLRHFPNFQDQFWNFLCNMDIYVLQEKNVQIKYVFLNVLLMQNLHHICTWKYHLLLNRLKQDKFLEKKNSMACRVNTILLKLNLLILLIYNFMYYVARLFKYFRFHITNNYGKYV